MGRNFRSSALYQKALRRKRHNAAKPRHIKKIIILGDSVAYGYGTKGGIARHLKDSFPDSEVLNFGINGLTSDGLSDRLLSGKWDQHLEAADLVLMNIGGNDLLKNFRKLGASGLIRNFKTIRRNYRNNLLGIYSKLRTVNPDVLIVQNDLYNSMKKEHQYMGLTQLLYRRWNGAIGERGVIISKTHAMGKNPSIWLDGVHPNDEGYKVMHELLINTLRTTGIALPHHTGNK